MPGRDTDRRSGRRRRPRAADVPRRDLGEPLCRAAGRYPGRPVLADSAARIRREYTQHARAEGTAWLQIGEALGLDQGPDGKSGYDLGVAAFEHFEGEPDLWNQSNFHYHCAACGEWITDRGPYESQPEDNERGHAEDCARFAAELSAWQAERDAWERGEG